MVIETALTELLREADPGFQYSVMVYNKCWGWIEYGPHSITCWIEYGPHSIPSWSGIAKIRVRHDRGIVLDVHVRGDYAIVAHGTRVELCDPGLVATILRIVRESL